MKRGFAISLIVVSVVLITFGLIFLMGSGGKATTILDYTKLLASLLEKDIEPRSHVEFRFGDTRHIVSDISKLKELGWQPKTPLKQTIREYLEWMYEQPEISDYYAEAEKVMKQQGVIRSIR